MKPVAYITKYDLERLPHHDCWVNGQEHKNSVPLYTHPVKELTDEEIINTLCENYDGDSGLVDRNLPKYHQSIVLFARALLRKVQEK